MSHLSGDEPHWIIGLLGAIAIIGFILAVVVIGATAINTL